MASARPPFVYYYVAAQNNYGHNYFLCHDVVRDDPKKYNLFSSKSMVNSNLRSSITIVPTPKITKSTIPTTSWRVSPIIWICPWITPCYSFWSCEYFTTRVSTTVSGMSTAIIPLPISSTWWRSFTVSTNIIRKKLNN